MLEVHNLTKKYKPKKGVPVLAVDHISLKFPEKGMVFLLGKSGSGKSTMLNLLGGLDVYDEGDIIIKGKSSKNFKQKDFDSYRNTYLGFIFQEYNILEEFNVGANIALALELQGIKATDDQINRILDEVDLTGYGNRKPNELSGGQKQRVAIARALVKDPEIILADEPTGALDSNTGRQVLDTLKKLSADKLVIVVSHDREFAENYADRIVELADGHVISDVEYTDSAEENPNPSAEAEKSTPSANLEFKYNTVAIAKGYHLSEEDRLAINEWLDQQDGKAYITTVASETVASVQTNGRLAKATDEAAITYSNKEPFKLIKSKLPLKNAFKIGVSGLKHKKVRLVFTILLSCIAFGLFGLADTMGCYKFASNCAKSIIDSDIHYATFEKAVKEAWGNGDYYWDTDSHYMTDEEVEEIAEDTGVDPVKVYAPQTFSGDFSSQYDNNASFTETDYHIYAYEVSGFAEMDQKTADGMGMTLLAGRFADGSKNEIVISSYLAQTFIIGGYWDGQGKTAYQVIKKPEDMVGKSLTLDETSYEIVGVVDTGFDLDRYKGLTENDETDDGMDSIVNYALSAELNSAQTYSLLQVAMVGDGFVERMQKEQINCGWLNSADINYYCNGDEANDFYMYTDNYATLSMAENADIVWLDGEKTSLADNEVIISEDYLCSLLGVEKIKDADLKNVPTLFMEAYKYKQTGTEEENLEDIKVVGYFTNSADLTIVPDRVFEKYMVAPEGTYEMAIGVMPESQAQIRDLVSYCYRDGDDVDVRYQLENSVTFELDALNDSFKTLGKVFFWIGIFFAVFASILMATFISSSIAYKKQEIGILRAIGARGGDVFRIFFAESLVIAMINFVLSGIGCGLITALMNSIIRKNIGILVTALNFGPRQVAILLLVSIAIAALASFFPVNHNARKKPIDAIRNR